MTRQRIFSILLVICAIVLPGIKAHAVDTAAQILAKCATKINNSPSLNVNFNLVSNGKTSTCTLKIAREKFALSSPEMQVWYDGQTQWTYTKSSRELSITEPTTDELLQCNPFAIINHYSQAYTCRRLSGKEPQIELAAKSQYSTVRKAVVFINPATDLPTKLIVTLSSGHTFTATVSSATIGQKPDASSFNYNKAKYPAKEINDLR